ncbi:MAG: Lrp/AsnC family transcriptional regulator [Deltaproteobacteria bacterium]|nr:Lrp/AsnC family transcriptional regulator [Deltaproteobacteria bacterium]
MMDSTDRNIIELLQKQGRMTNVELARSNDLAPSSMLERVRRLEERGVIKNYQAILDPKALGYNVQAMVMISLDRHQAGPIDLFEEKIHSVPEVKTCYHLTGRYDYVVHLIVRDIDHLGEVVKHTLAGIVGVEKQETFLVLSTVKEDEGYSLDGIPGTKE